MISDKNKILGVNMANVARIAILGRIAKIKNENEVVLSISNRKDRAQSFIVVYHPKIAAFGKGSYATVIGNIEINKNNGKQTPVVNAFSVNHILPVEENMTEYAKITIDGTITRDAEMVSAGGALNIVKTAIAVNTYDKSAENNQHTSFYNLAFFRRDALQGMLRRGTFVTCLVGELQVNPYKTTKGEDRVDISIVVEDINFFNPKKDKEAWVLSAPEQEMKTDEEDEIPF